MDLNSQKIIDYLKRSTKMVSDFFVAIRKIAGIKSKRLSSQAEWRQQSDKDLVYSLAPTKIPRREQLKHLGKFLDPREKVVLKIAILVLTACIIYLGYRFYNNNLILLPKIGGTYSEGVVGYPQTINPLYASTRDVDADITRLIYSSLFSYDQNGRLMADLASGWTIGDGGKSYTVTLRDGVKWQSGESLSVDDFIFTFNLIKDPEFRSPLRTSLNGAQVEKIDDHTIKFTLAEPYADFLSLLTFGVMPQNAWEMILPEAASLSELNLKPIGSGPYMFESLIKNKGGSIKEYHLTVNPEYYGTHPYIEKLIIKFYPDYTELVRALNDNEINGASYVPEDLRGDLVAKHSLQINNLRLPQINAIFFNSDKNKILAELKVRQALAYAIDRTRLIGEVLGGAANIVDGPILAGDYVSVPESNKYNFDRAKAEQLLEDSGYKKIEVSADMAAAQEKTAEVEAITDYASSTKQDAVGYWRVYKVNKSFQPLVIKLSTPENSRVDVAESIKKDWEAVGVKVEINKVAADSVNSEMIATHNFEAFLYGQVVGFEPDISSFWHSSQIGGQGLNLAGYNNSVVDTLLTEARQAADNVAVRQEKYTKIQAVITAEVPAIFLYSPTYTYVQAKRVRGFNGTAISEPYDRFADIASWYLKTKKRIDW